MNKKKWIISAIVVLLVTNLISFYGGSVISLYAPNGKVMVSRKDYNRLNEVKEAIAPNEKLSDYFSKYSGVAKFKKLFDVKDQLYKYYDGAISDDVLVEGAVKGMTNALNDPYTVFMNKKDYESFNSQISGTYSGVGLQVEAQDENIKIMSVFDGSPAKKAGIMANDIIVKVDGKDVSGKDLDTAVSLMKGVEGSSVTITLNRASKGVFDVKLNRQKITLDTIKGEVLENNIGLIQISMFDENTGSNFSKKLEELKSKNIKGLIIDLRENPGGSLDQCVDVTSNFVKKGDVIVSTIDKNKKKQVAYSSGGLAIGMPLVVLVDENSASASEIFSGAIKDYKVGTLVGHKTFGKGIVQEIFTDPTDGTATKITVSKYYTPSGVNIHKIGITPDVVVDYPDTLKTKTYDRNVDPQFQKALEVMKDKIK